MKIAQNQQVFLNIFIKETQLSSSDVYDRIVNLGYDTSLVTVKRELADMKMQNLLQSSGAGRSVAYSITTLGRLFTFIDTKTYTTLDPDKRWGQKDFNRDLLRSLPSEFFEEAEIAEFEKETRKYVTNASSVSKTIEEKELERFIIELSWKSSKIEGNTYTLLDTEKLLEKGIEAEGHDKTEAVMIINHKTAFKFIRDNSKVFHTVDLAKIEEVHKILVKDLNIHFGLRSKMIGVTGSLYKPLDNIHQIKEAVTLLCDAINAMKSPYSKALLAVLGISYIQPFEDGNKRTARLLANAILLSYGCAPLSYRSVEEDDYREAVLVFYELNSVLAFKKIFYEQYLFSTKHYSVV